MAFPAEQNWKEPDLVLGCRNVVGTPQLRDEWNLTGQHVLSHLSSNDRSVKALDLSGMIFTMTFFEGLKTALVHNETLQQLYLEGCEINDQATRLLQQAICSSTARVLKTLSLANNRIGSIGASCLSRALSGKEWSRTFNGRRSLPFGPGKGLRQLNLAKNQIGPVGAKMLAQALSATDDSLQELDLRANQIDDWGAGWIAMSLRNNNVLQRVDLRKNPINFEGIREVGMACELVKAQLLLDEYQAENDEEKDEKDEDEGSRSLRVLIPAWRNLTILVSDPRITIAEEELSPEDEYSDPFPAVEENEVTVSGKWTVEGWSNPTGFVHDGAGLPSAVDARQGMAHRSVSDQSLQRNHSSQTFRRRGKIRRPVAVWRQNWSLGIGEPASVASDSPGVRERVSPGLASTFLANASIPYRNDPPLDAAVATLQPKFRRCEDEKELCTVLVPSRWRWKPRHGYSPEREHGQTFVWPLPKTNHVYGGRNFRKPVTQRCSSAPARRASAAGPQDMAPRWSTFKMRPSQHVREEQ